MTSPLWRDIGLVLAAGEGCRYGQPKAAVIWQGERLVDRSIRLLHEAGCAQVVVVLGAWVQALEGCRSIVNPHWSSGMASSLRCGLGALAEANEDSFAPPVRAIITLVDLPGMTAEAIRRVRARPESLVAACYGGQRGHPVLIGRQHWPDLEACLTGDQGAGPYLKQQAQELCLVEVGDIATGADLDHPFEVS